MSIFYKPEIGWAGDVIPFYDDTDGLFKPFYLKTWRNLPHEGDLGWHMLTSEDNLHFTETPTIIDGGTGSVIRIGEVYHLFFCTFEHDPERQWIRHAVSYDKMKSWKEIEEEAFLADDVIYQVCDLRDPFVFWNEEESCWWMLVASMAKGPTTRRGCVGLLKSDDLAHWRFCEPFYSPENNLGGLECPDLFKMGDWYYLIYSVYTDRFQTVYRMSRSLNGPWITPPVDTFDTRAYYAAKSVSDGKDRYLYGWNPTRGYDNREYSRKADLGKDYEVWDWAGTIVVHKIIQQPDGALTVSPIESVQKAFTTPQPIDFSPLTGKWSCEGDKTVVETPYSYSALKMSKVPELCKLEMDVTFNTPTRQFGVALQIDDNFDLGYYLVLEPYRNRVQFKTGAYYNLDGHKRLPSEIEMERPLTLEVGKKHHIELYVQDSILVAYFDNKVALNARMYNFTGRNFGLFATDGNVTFENIRLSTL